MKKNILFLFGLFIVVNTLIGQNSTEFYDTEHSFTQNFPVSPNNRKIIAIELPKGTTSIVYRITVGKKNQEIGESLVDAVNSIPNPAAATVGAFAKLIVSLSSYEAKYFIFSNEENAKKYRTDQPFNYCKTTSELTNSTVKMLSNNCFGNSKYLYFGFHTNEMLIDYHITLEVVPKIKKEATLNGWTASKKQEAYNNFNQLFTNSFKGQLKQSDIDDFTGCLMSKITSNYTPDQLSALAEYELKNMLGKFGDKCSIELNINFEDVAVPQQNINKDHLIGKWKDQNSTFTIYKNGTILLIFDNGKSLFGNWELNENKLKFVFDFGKTIDEYIIIELTDKTFKYKGTKEQTVWSANKIGKY